MTQHATLAHTRKRTCVQLPQFPKLCHTELNPPRNLPLKESQRFFG